LCGGVATARYLNGIPEDSRAKIRESNSYLSTRWWDKYFGENTKDGTIKKLN
jgi:aryl-alcohol dehydrogenase-like predicted oxidoreductase